MALNRAFLRGIPCRATRWHRASLGLDFTTVSRDGLSVSDSQVGDMCRQCEYRRVGGEW